MFGRNAVVGEDARDWHVDVRALAGSSVLQRLLLAIMLCDRPWVNHVEYFSV